MTDNINMEYHYYTVPKELSQTVESCWQALSDYLKENAKWRLIFLREPPQVVSERNFDTKELVYKGFVRFYAGPMLEDSDTINIPSIGSI